MIVVCSLFIVHYLQAVIASVMTVVGLITVHCSLFASCDRLCNDRNLFIVYCSLFAGRDRLCDEHGRFIHCSLFTIRRL